MHPDEAVKPSSSAVYSASLSTAHLTDTSLPRPTMITRGLRRPSLMPAISPQGLGVVIRGARAAREYGPSSSRNIMPGPPISWSALRKGKQRASADIDAGYHGAISMTRTTVAYTRYGPHAQLRHFHVTRPRNALPLIPATAAILKSTSILTVITYISRILISFFPIGTLAAFRFKRVAKWLDAGHPPPESTEDAEEFYLMWCRGENPRRVSQNEAIQLVNVEAEACGGLRLPDGRIAHQIRLPKQFRPRAESNTDRQAQFMRKTCFFLPALPPASVRFFHEFSIEEQGQIQRLRTYWIGVRMIKDRLKLARGLMVLLFGLPVVLLFGVWIAALERTPLTGRWRLILLTPEEEDHISRTLSGQNWYKSVINLLTTPESPAPPIVPLEDWRWQWVATTLRQLEAVVVNEASRLDSSGEESTKCPLPAQQAKLGIPTPPSTGYPIRPRPRMSCVIHSALPGGDKSTGQEHLELGPPYSLLIMEKNERNAFSYGFGGKGAGGIVVYTGLLDKILREGVPDGNTQAPQGFWSSLLGSSSRPRPQPTEQQTLHLACVLAHEMGHLLLSHHLETLSQQQVLWPSVLGLGVDLTRAFIWPLTFFLGPTVNDALANVGRTGVSELSDKYGEIGFQWKHEYEADFAGIRLLALAGFDPRAAVAHFSDSVADLHEIQPLDKEKDDTLTRRLFKLWTETTHPSAEQRVAAIKQELDRWDWPGALEKSRVR